MRNLAKSLWRGDIRLVDTYWRYCVLGSFLLAIPMIVLVTTKWEWTARITQPIQWW